jgi:DNA-binding MarR family transcriptional regulator
MDKDLVKKAELAGLKVMKVSEVIQGAAQALFKEHGLSAPQYNVLRILRGAGQAGLNCHDLSARMVKRVPDITRLLDRLVEKSLVTRNRSDRDRRVVISALTRKGRKLLQNIDAPLEKQVGGNFPGFSSDDLNQFTDLLDRILAGHANGDSCTDPTV